MLGSPYEINPIGALAAVSDPPVLSVRGLSRRYGDRVALEGLDMSVGRGEVVGLVGPNGAGKTTTLRCVVGLLEPDAGSISIDGHDLRTDLAAAKRASGYVPDEPEFFSYLTVGEHLLLAARLYAVADGRQRAEALLTHFDLGDRWDAYPDELSRGMRRKLALVASLLPEPALVVLDEPFTALDPPAIRDLRAAIETQAAGGVGFLLSSHLLALVERIATRIVILDRGRKVVEGTLAELRAELGGTDDLDTLFDRAVRRARVPV
jgi:ABC-2 type transport system ATP-binding protein